MSSPRPTLTSLHAHARTLTSLVAQTAADTLLRAVVAHLLAHLHEERMHCLSLTPANLAEELHRIATTYLDSQTGSLPRKASSARAASLVMAAMAGEILGEVADEAADALTIAEAS